MDAIKRIVSEIVFMCRVRNIQVSETLAAFMARAVVLEHADQFPLDKELNESDVQDLIKLTTERLLEQDSPSLETVKMQVGFDTARVQEQEKLEKIRVEREGREGQLLREITDAKLKGGNDVEALTSLYRRIFNFLVMHAGLEPGADRPAEREIAAALESVFPRIGLKAFTALPAEDKTAQLHELANIVLGIRLFNRHIGKGGAGIQDLPRVAAELAESYVNHVGEELDEVGTLTEQYADVIGHKYRTSIEGKKPKRLQQELTNRRQYATYLSQLDDSFQQSARHIEEMTRLFLKEMDALKQLVGSRSSVPKEQVYPRFDSLAKLWAAFEDEIQLLKTRGGTLDELRKFQESYIPTLRSDDLAAARAAKRAEEALGGVRGPGPAAMVDSSTPGGGGDSAAAVAQSDGSAPGGLLDGGDDDKPFRITSEIVPQVIQLSLEIEGFCVWTLVERNGLLLPGSASCLVRYKKRYYTFVDETALQAFMENPEKYAQGVLVEAKKAPELIHLLRLQEHFPAASISEIMRQTIMHPSGSHTLLAPAKSFQDSTSQTPTHFIEKHIDVNYEWNEWALRRRALHLTNLRQKVTKSQQTYSSQFRREAESQVYLPKDSNTQTSITTGTSAPIMANYICGLRGDPDSDMQVMNLTVDPDITIGKHAS